MYILCRIMNNCDLLLLSFRQGPESILSRRIYDTS